MGLSPFACVPLPAAPHPGGFPASSPQAGSRAEVSTREGFEALQDEGREFSEGITPW